MTAQRSEVVERAVGSVFVPWLAKHGFGEHQYAYTKKRHHRDVLAVNVCNWLLLFEAEFSIGLFYINISGALIDFECNGYAINSLRLVSLKIS